MSTPLVPKFLNYLTNTRVSVIVRSLHVDSCTKGQVPTMKVVHELNCIYISFSNGKTNLQETVIFMSISENFPRYRRFYLLYLTFMLLFTWGKHRPPKNGNVDLTSRRNLPNGKVLTKSLVTIISPYKIRLL